MSSSSSLYDPSAQTTVCPTGWRDLTAGPDGWLYAASDDATATKAGLYRVVYSETGATMPIRVKSRPHRTFL